MQPNDLGNLTSWLQNIRDVYRLHSIELDSIESEEIRYRRLVELNVYEMDGFVFQKCVEQRSGLIDHLGGCGRILKTPLARSEAIQVRQFIFLLLVTLPIGLMQAFDANSSNPSSFMQGINQVGIVALYVMLLAPSVSTSFRWIVSAQRSNAVSFNYFTIWKTRRLRRLALEMLNCHLVRKLRRKTTSF